MTQTEFVNWLNGFLKTCGEDLHGFELELIRIKLRAVLECKIKIDDSLNNDEIMGPV